MNSTVVALTHILLTDMLRIDLPKDDARVQKTATTLTHKIKCMPLILRTGIMGLTFAFNKYALFTTGKCFDRQGAVQQRRQITQWKNSRVGLCRNVTTFYTKMTAFIYYSQNA